MNYKMTEPCDACPFRNDEKRFLLSPERIEEIRNSLVRSEFPCHKTMDYEDDEPRQTKSTQHCAGALILLEKEERPSQMMRICERVGMYDRTKLNMDAPVWDSFDDLIAQAEEDEL